MKMPHDKHDKFGKSILTNIGAKKGKTKFDIFFDKNEDCIILKAAKAEEEGN